MPRTRIVATTLLALLAATWYVLASLGRDRWPGGASPPGLTFGIVAGVILLFEAAYSVRRRLVNWQLGSRPAGLRAHVQLGLLTVPLIAMHSGFRSGGSLTTSLLTIYVLVVASGVALSMFQRLRTRQSEPALSIDRNPLESDLRQQAAELVSNACGESLSQCNPAPFQSITIERSRGPLQGRTVQLHIQRTPDAHAEPLRVAFVEVIERFLLPDAPTSSPLRSATSSRRWFAGLRQRIPESLAETVDLLENLSDQRRQLLDDSRAERWSKLCLLIHEPLTAALVVLLLVHAAMSLRYL
ncbi:MAG: hypothetical protein HZA46_00680 [Planctomycetales bacterium]|nr:hypothetical protein [Planctomycetales bacterium]